MCEPGVLPPRSVNLPGRELGDSRNLRERDLQLYAIKIICQWQLNDVYTHQEGAMSVDEGDVVDLLFRNADAHVTGQFGITSR